jgi:hypothetical protein
MFTKTPEPEQELWQKLLNQVGPKIAALAGVDTSTYTGFLPGVGRALRRWELDMAFHAKAGSPADVRSGNPDRLLYRMLEHVKALHGQLQDLIENGYTGKDDVLLNIGAKLEIELDELETGSVSLDEVARSISCLETAICRSISGAVRPRGALPEVDRYPGLLSLVVNLQRMARCSGAKKYTAHRKSGGKGTIVRALDQIRTFLEKNGEWQAECLPARDRHPVATYERLFRHMRSQISPEDLANPVE